MRRYRHHRQKEEVNTVHESGLEGRLQIAGSRHLPAAAEQWAGAELRVPLGAQLLPGAQLQVQLPGVQAQLVQAELEAPPQPALEPGQLPQEPLQLPAWPAPPQPSPASSAGGAHQAIDMRFLKLCSFP